MRRSEADAAQDDLAVQRYAGALSLPLVWSGRFSEAREVVARLQRALGPHGHQLGVGTGTLALAQLTEMAVYEGRFADAYQLLATPVAAGPPELVTVAAIMAHTACISDDPARLERAEQLMAAREVATPVQPALGHVRYARAQFDGRTAVAADIAVTIWRQLERAQGVRGGYLTLAVVPLVDNGQLQLAQELIEECAADLDRFGRRPLPLASLLHARALVALHQDWDEDALETTYALLDLASASGFLLLTIDALELLGALHHRRNAAVVAPRLFGAAARLVKASATGAG